MKLKKLKWKKIIWCSVLSILAVIILAVILDFNIFEWVNKYPDDRKLLSQESSLVFKQEEVLEIATPLLPSVFVQSLKKPLSKENLKEIQSLKDSGYLAKHRTIQSEVVCRFSTGKGASWLDEKASFILPGDNEISIPAQIGKNQALHFSALPLATGTENINNSRALSVFLEINGKRIPLLQKSIPTYHRENFFKVAPLADSRFPAVFKQTGWENIQIDLSAYANKKANFIFLFDSPKSPSNLNLIANPIIYQKTQKERYNILYLVFDGTALPFLSVYNEKSGLSPFLKSKQNEFVKFNNMYSIGTKTRIFVSGFMTSKHSPVTRHGANFNYYTEEDKNTFYHLNDKNQFSSFPKALKKNGYLTLQVGNCGFAHPVLFPGFDYGFDENFEYQQMPYDTTGNAYHLLRILKEVHNKPFYIYTHFNTTHFPRTAPFHYFIKGVMKYIEMFWRPNILGSFVYADDVFRYVYTYLERNKLLEKTILIVSADHGTSYNFKHFFGNALYQDYIKIPFLIRFPEKLKKELQVKHQEVHTTTSIINFAPTMLDILNLPQDELFSGKSVKQVFSSTKLPAYTDEWVFSYDNYGFSMIYRARWKYIQNQIRENWEAVREKDSIFSKKGKEEAAEQIYDLQNDPEETHNLFFERPDLVKIFREKAMDNPYWPQMNIISVFPDKTGQKHQVKIEIQGQKIGWLRKAFLDESKENKIIQTKNGYEIYFTLGKDPKYFIWETNPSDSFQKVQIVIDDKNIRNENLFSGPYSLNTLKNPFILSGKKDYLPFLSFARIKENPGKNDQPNFHYSRIDIRRWLRTESTKFDQPLTELESGMRSVLKSWGYIQ